MLHPREHWSYSAISQYLRCPLQYYFERVLKLPRKSTPSSMVLGSAVHSALAFYHQAIASQQTVDRSQVIEIIVQSWNDRSNRETIEFKEGESQSQLIDQSISLIELYLTEPPPSNIIAIEKPLWVPIITSSGQVLEKPLLAIADLITRPNEQVIVEEFKTSGRSYSESEVAMSLQATCYVHAVSSKFDEVPDVQFTVFVKTKTPKLQRLSTFRSPSELERVGDLILEISTSIDARLFYPIESPMNCSGCSFRTECKLWRSSRKIEDERQNLQPMNGKHVCSLN